MGLAAQIASWLLPPILGALIGCAAALIVVRALTRAPSKRPARRRAQAEAKPNALADQVAELVATELLTEDAIRRQIASPAFHRSVVTGVSSLTLHLLDRPLDALAHAPGEGSEGAGALVGELVRALFESPRFRALARAWIGGAVARLADLPLSVLSGERANAVAERVALALSSPDAQRAVHALLDDWVDRTIAEGVVIGELLSSGDVEALARGVDQLFGPAAEFLLRWLRSDEMKRDLSVRGRYLVHDVIDRLTGIQRLIVSAAQFERTLDSNMEGIIADAVASADEALHDPDARRRLVEAARRELEELRAKTLAEVSSPERLKQGVAEIADRLLGLLERPELRQGLLRGLEAAGRAREPDREEGAAGGPPATLGSLLDRIFGGAAAGELVAELVLGPESGAGGGSPGWLGTVLQSGLGAMRGVGLGELLGIDAERKARIDEAIAAFLVRTVDAKISEILASVDLRDLVRRRIETIDGREIGSFFAGSFSGARVGLFGAAIGAAIGLVNDLARLIFV